MALSLNKPKLDNLASDIWKSAGRPRDNSSPTSTRASSCRSSSSAGLNACCEFAKPIIRWADSRQLGYQILHNKYFYRCQPPTPAKDLLAEFWRLGKEAEKLLEGLSQ